MVRNKIIQKGGKAVFSWWCSIVLQGSASYGIIKCKNFLMRIEFQKVELPSLFYADK